MENSSKGKIDAIYELRESVEKKVRAEVAVEQQGTALNRDRLLDATLSMEAKTQDAIEACHQCGEAHDDDHTHGAAPLKDNVINVDFAHHERREDQPIADEPA